LIESDIGDDSGDPPADMFDLPPCRLGRTDLLRNRIVGWGHRMHSLIERRHDVTGPQDRLPGRLDSAAPADRYSGRRAGIGPGTGPDSIGVEPELDRLRSADDIQQNC